MYLANFMSLLAKLILLQKKDSNKMANIASFISELQDNLSNEAFQMFKAALSKYKEVE